MFYKQKVTISCQNILSVAESSLAQHSGLKKVILVPHPPRFDKPNVDPISLKPALAQLANRTLHDLWLNSAMKHKIHIGEHNLACSEDTRIRRYTDKSSKRYDGVHMYGDKKAFTLTVLTMLQNGLPFSSSSHQDSDYHKTCPQTQYAKGGVRSYPEVSNRFSVFNTNQGNL